MSSSFVTLAAGLRRSEAQFEPPPGVRGSAGGILDCGPAAPGNAFGVFHFRRVLELAAQPARFVVHVSADNRYRLFVNGQQVSSGPQRSDLMHWRYETVDLAPHLRAGRNVLAALVWNWGAERPVAQFSRRTAFLLQGDSEREAVVNTGPEWKVFSQRRLRADPGRGPAAGGYYASPPGESVDGAATRGAGSRTDFADDELDRPRR